MSTQVQRRKGTTAQHASFTGASAELTVDTTKNTVVVHDGATAGGIPLAKETGSALSVTSLTSSGAAVIETTDNTNAALRITQLGTGNALLIEDSASPDSSPVVVTNNGTLVVGNTARVSSTSLIEAHSSANVSGTPAIANYSWGIPVGGGGFNLYKSRSGTVGTQALVASGTQSSVRFYFDDGVAFQQAASIIGVAEGTPALNSMPGRLAFNTSADGSVTPTERMRLDSAGNLGLGVTPSAWGSNYKVLQGQAGGYALSNDGTQNNQMRLSSNAYNNGTNWIYYGTSLATSYEQRVGEHRWYNALSGTAGTAITFTQAMTLDASGRLGIGVTSLSEYLTVKSPNSSTFFNLQTATDSGVYMGNNAGSLTLLTGATERARIDSSGNLLVGTTSVYNSARVSVLAAGGSGGIVFSVQNNNDVYYPANFRNTASTSVGNIACTATTTTYNITSDQRLKENIQDAAPVSALIDSLQVRQYDWKADGSHQRYGFVAQELVTVAPEAVHQPTNPEEMMAVDYSKLVPMLVKELQSLRARVAQLESK